MAFCGGIRYLDDASVNPVELLNLMRSKLKADIFENTEVFGWRPLVAQES